MTAALNPERSGPSPPATVRPGRLEASSRAVRQHVAAGRCRDDVAFRHRAAAAGRDRVAVRRRRLAGVLAAVTSHAAMESFRVTLTISFAVAVINLVFGLLIAWVLTRDEFPGKRLVDAIIDLPFALPTIVASLVMLALYGPSSPVGSSPAAHRSGASASRCCSSRCRSWCASVQPVLLELDREAEEAAASLGANNRDDLHLGDPACVAAVVAVRCGTGVFARDRRVRLGGADRRRGARRDRGVVAVDPDADRERRPHRCRRDLDCAACRFRSSCCSFCASSGRGRPSVRSWRSDAVAAGSLPAPLRRAGHICCCC